MAQRLRTEERLLTNSNPIALPRHPTSASSWTWTSGFVRVLVVTEAESLVWLENPSILLFSCFTLLVVYWRGTTATFFAFVLPFSSDSCWSSVGVWSTTGSCHGKPWAARATGASATHEQPSPSSCCHSARARLDCLAKSLSLVTREAQIPPDRENHFFSFSPAGLEVKMKPNVVQSALMWISCKWMILYKAVCI